MDNVKLVSQKGFAVIGICFNKRGLIIGDEDYWDIPKGYFCF